MGSQHRRRKAKRRQSIPSRRRSDELIRISRRRATSLNIESLEERRLLAADFDLLSGSRVDRAIDAAGDVDRFDFVVAAPTRVCFDSFTNDSQLNWSLTGPAGSLVNQRDFTDSDSWSTWDPAIDLAPGTYQIVVSGDGGHTGPYGFRLIDLSAAVEITPGVQVDGTLDPAAESDAYRFSATAGDKFYFDALSASTQNATWRLIDPYGHDVFQTSLSDDVGTQVLPADGDYTLLIEGYIVDAGTTAYSFNVQPQGHDVIPPFTGTPMSLGDTINGDIGRPARKTRTRLRWRQTPWRRSIT